MDLYIVRTLDRASVCSQCAYLQTLCLESWILANVVRNRCRDDQCNSDADRVRYLQRTIPLRFA